MGWLDKLRAKRNKTEAEIAAQRAGGRWESEGGALAPEPDDSGSDDNPKGE